MHVPSNRRNCPRQRGRGWFVGGSMLAAVGLGGAAKAVSFDEKISAPMMRTTAEFQAQVEPFAARYRALRETNPGSS